MHADGTSVSGQASPADVAALPSSSASGIAAILTGRTKDAERLFYQYDLDGDGRLTKSEVYTGLQRWELGLNDDMFQQFVECNFLYADRDLDGTLSQSEWMQLFKLMSEVRHLHFHPRSLLAARCSEVMCWKKPNSCCTCVYMYAHAMSSLVEPAATMHRVNQVLAACRWDASFCAMMTTLMA